MAKSICLVPCLNRNTYETTSQLTNVAIPLGVLSLHAQIQANPECGYSADFLDLNLEIEGTGIELDRGFYDFAANLLAERNADVYGFSTICNTYIDVLEISKRLKALRPEAPIVYGGAQASITDVRTLEVWPSVDVVVRGEAEHTLIELLKALDRRDGLAATRGITYRGEEGRILRNAPAPIIKDLDDLPTPSYELYAKIIKSYSEPREDGMEFVNAIPVEVGRGCPFSCTFCVTNDYFVKTFRMKSQRRILEELRLLSRDFEASLFHFHHDMFTVNRAKVIEFCRVLEESDLKISWNCSARIDCVDEEIVDSMASVGCKTIFFGLESGSRRIQKAIKKNLKLEDVEEKLDRVRERGIKPILSFIIGFPDEDRQDLQATMDLFLRQVYSESIAHISILSPKPGTPITKEYRDRLRFDLYDNDERAPVVLEQDTAFLSKHPDLFSDCFYIEPALDRDLHKFILMIADQLGDFRWSIWSLVGSVEFPFELFDLWKSWHGGSVPSFPWFSGATEAGDTLAHFLKSMVLQNKVGAAWYRDVVEFEARLMLAKRHARIKRLDGGGDNRQSEQIDDSGSAFSLEFNILQVFETLRENPQSLPRHLPFERESTTHLIVEGESDLTVISYPSLSTGEAK